MPYVDVAGVQVNFPFQPYDCQIAYIEKVLTCLQKGWNGVLESPTGTGKTLCLLTASLAWLEVKKAQVMANRWRVEQTNDGSVQVPNEFKDEMIRQLDKGVGGEGGWDSMLLGVPKIIYASRTHSQLGQAMSELKRTAYSHFKASVIGSREQLCIHPSVMNEQNNTVKVQKCRAKVKARSCHFYNKVETTKDCFANKLLDIEDLITVGQKHSCCPYYHSRELKKDADIIFMPYNYLVDPKLRLNNKIEVQGNIVIFDEAHNLEQMCEETASFDLSSSDLASCIRDLTALTDQLQEWNRLEEVTASGFGDNNEKDLVPDFTLEDVLKIKAQVLSLEEAIDNLAVTTQGVTKPGVDAKQNTEKQAHGFVKKLFDKANITFESKYQLTSCLEKMISSLTTSSLHGSGIGLSKLLEVIQITFSRECISHTPLDIHKKAVSKNYRVHIKPEESRFKGKKSEGWGATVVPSKGLTVSYWCFSPSHAMQELKALGAKCIILTSGTLTPINSFASEMGLDFPVLLENPHIIDTKQVFIAAVCNGPDSVELSSAYDNRFKDTYQRSLGNSVVNFSRCVPHGMLLFFPSYPVMQKSLEVWRETGIYSSLERNKQVFVEPRSKFEFTTAMKGYYDSIDKGGGLFAAVCRGKVSEGLDFADNNGRAVIITGLPYPPRMDPRVTLKMKFLDESRSNGAKGLTGEDWYRLQATRAVNQAIGRVIRHRHDYGAILLCDLRFAHFNSQNQLPQWLRPCLKKYDKFGCAIKDLISFFKELNPTAKNALTKSSSVAGAAFEITPNIQRIPVKDLYKIVVDSKAPVKDEAVDIKDAARLYKSSAVTASARPTSLLGALDHVGESKKWSSTDEYKTAYDSSVKKANLNSDGQKRKIKLIPNCKQPVSSQVEDNSGPGASVAKSADSKPSESKKLNEAEQYVNEVKKALSKESYKRFSSAMREYHTSSNYDLLIQCLLELFLDDSRHHVLLRNFIRYVKKADREKFNQMCLDYTGEGCVLPAKTSASVSAKKRVSSSSSCSTEKRVKEEESQASVSLPQPVVRDLDKNKIRPAVTPEDCIKRLVKCSKSGRSVFNCGHCGLTAMGGLISTCNHICCCRCWKIIMKDSKCCPVCGLKLRRKSLTRFFT